MLNTETVSTVGQQKAIAWYHEWASFEHVKPHLTYAQALAKNSDRKWITKAGRKELVLHNKVIKAIFKQNQNSVKKVQHSVNLHKAKPSHYVTNQSPCRAIQNVPVSTNNRFQVLVC